jgi:UDP-glucose 4-epimerase
VADPSRAKALLGWEAKRSGLDQIVADALRWETKPAYGSGLRSPAARPAVTAAE